MSLSRLGILASFTGRNNSLNDGRLFNCPIVQLLRKPDKGIEAGYGTTRLEGRTGLCQVPLANIQLGAVLSRPGPEGGGGIAPITATNTPRLLFNSMFNNFDCYVNSLRLPESSPLDIWIRTKAPPTAGMPTVWSFRTQRKTILKPNPRSYTLNPNERIQFFSTQWNKDTRISLFDKAVPREGTPLEHWPAVNVMIEITIDPDVEYPHSYLRLPTLGPFDSWSQAFRVGIRIEFQGGGIWKSRYLSTTHYCPVSSMYKSLKAEDLGNGLNHIELSWLHCMKTLATLLNWRWKPENNPVRDNLTQAVWALYSIRLFIIDFDFHVLMNHIQWKCNALGF
ncbi:hypothetical protein IWW34DRAFT_875807 [Fusarium oxysporum f. sp. albedinis]|nr:hypothetical protein IWW34DRAFT_875807 [Fusarium oxysporum f. sp. albedinis]